MFDFESQRNQLVYQERIVTGVTKFDGEIDGVRIDSTTLFTIAPFNEEAGNALGFGIAKVKFGTSQNFNLFRGLNFPLTMQLAFKTVTGSSGKSQTVLVDFRLPQQQGKAAPKE